MRYVCKIYGYFPYKIITYLFRFFCISVRIAEFSICFLNIDLSASATIAIRFLTSQNIRKLSNCPVM